MSIKATLKTAGWQDILKIIEEEVAIMCDVRNLTAEDPELLGKEAMARAEAVHLITAVLKRIKIASQDIKSKPISYK